jgi:hypothetical protein
MGFDTVVLGGLTLGFDALIIMIWILPADKILRIPGGRVGYRRTPTTFKTPIRSTITPIIHTSGHC